MNQVIKSNLDDALACIQHLERAFSGICAQSHMDKLVRVRQALAKTYEFLYPNDGMTLWAAGKMQQGFAAKYRDLLDRISAALPTKHPSGRDYDEVADFIEKYFEDNNEAGEDKAATYVNTTNSVMDVFAFVEKEGVEESLSSFWIKVGACFPNRDGSLNVYLDALPTNGRLQIRNKSKGKTGDSET